MLKATAFIDITDTLLERLAAGFLKVLQHKTCPVSIQTQSLALRALRENFTQQTQAPMLGRSSGNHDWLLANARACVSCGFRLRARNARNASDCV